MAMTASNTLTVMNKIKYAILALATLVAAASCSTKEFDEITELNLSRCLAPMGLNAHYRTEPFPLPRPDGPERPCECCPR